MDGSQRKHMYKKSFRKNNQDKYKKFKGNVKEGQGFADKRKRKIKHEYLKILKKQRKEGETSVTPTVDNNSDTDHSESDSKPHTQRSHKNTGGKFTGVLKDYHSKQEEKERRKKEAIERRRAREGALKKYKEGKQDRHKKLCKRTYKGQPVMKNQIEFLLQKIEKQVNKT